MPEIKCWNGATLTTVANYTVVDQCYCSTSTNAQSGVAVAQIAALRNSTICIATPTSTTLADSTLLLSGANGNNPASLASYPATSISAYVWSKICGCTIANATCFGGCTYACAKADIRNYTPTAVSGTVTLTAPTTVGKSTCITSAATTDGFDIYGCWRSVDNYDLILNLRDDGTNYVGFACNGTVKSYICASNGCFYSSNGAVMGGYTLTLSSATGGHRYVLLNFGGSNQRAALVNFYNETGVLAKYCGGDSYTRFGSAYTTMQTGFISNTSSCVWVHYGGWVSPILLATYPITVVCDTTTAPSGITFKDPITLTTCTGTVTSVNVSVNGVSGTAVTGSGTVTLSNVPPHFANNTLYTVGDDVKIGDVNVGGKLGIQGANADTPGFVLRNSAGTVLGCLYATSSILCWTGCICASTAVCAPTVCGTTVVRASTICGGTFQFTDSGIDIGTCVAGATALAVHAIAIGTASSATGASSIALGSYAQATSVCSIALGSYAQATSVCSIALGSYARACNAHSIAIGYNTVTCNCNAACIVKDIKFGILRTIAVQWVATTLQCDVFNAFYCRLNFSAICFTTSSTRHIMGCGSYGEYPLSTIKWDCAESPLNIDLQDFGTIRKTIFNACTCTMACAGYMELTYITR